MDLLTGIFVYFCLFFFFLSVLLSFCLFVFCQMMSWDHLQTMVSQPLSDFKQHHWVSSWYHIDLSMCMKVFRIPSFNPYTYLIFSIPTDGYNQVLIKKKKKHQGNEYLSTFYNPIFIFLILMFWLFGDDEGVWRVFVKSLFISFFSCTCARISSFVYEEDKK